MTALRTAAFSQALFCPAIALVRAPMGRSRQIILDSSGLSLAFTCSFENPVTQRFKSQQPIGPKSSQSFTFVICLLHATRERCAFGLDNQPINLNRSPINKRLRTTRALK